MTIQPQGLKILVKKIEKPNYITEGKIEIVNNDLGYGEVVEFSKEFTDIYEKGTIVKFPSGAGMTEYYNGETCLWLNGEGAPTGDIWAIVTDEK